jgi:hypothetical protein
MLRAARCSVNVKCTLRGESRYRGLEMKVLLQVVVTIRGGD